MLRNTTEGFFIKKKRKTSIVHFYLKIMSLDWAWSFKKSLEYQKLYTNLSCIIMMRILSIYLHPTKRFVLNNLKDVDDIWQIEFYANVPTF